MRCGRTRLKLHGCGRFMRVIRLLQTCKSSKQILREHYHYGLVLKRMELDRLLHREAARNRRTENTAKQTAADCLSVGFRNQLLCIREVETCGWEGQQSALARAEAIKLRQSRQESHPLEFVSPVAPRASTKPVRHILSHLRLLIMATSNQEPLEGLIFSFTSGFQASLE